MAQNKIENMLENNIRSLPKSDERLSWAVLDGLIGRIYECALDPSQWNETLTHITAALSPLSWDVAFLLWESSRPPTARFVGATGLAPGVADIYANVYRGDNPWSRHILPLRNGTLVDTDELMSRQELLQSALYRDFLQRWRLDRALALMLDRRGGERLALVMPGPADRQLDGLKRGLRTLAPHIQRAVRISHRIASLELAAGAAQVAADHANFAILTLDASLNVITANRRVAEFIARRVITLSQDKLAFVHSLSHRQLQALARATPPSGIAFQALGKGSVEYPVLGALIPAQNTRPLGGILEGAALIIMIGNAAGERPVIEINRIAAWFGLTPSEARLAAALTSGTTIQEYVDARNISTNAARFLLKGVFRKTGATTQAQLVAMLAQLPQ